MTTDTEYETGVVTEASDQPLGDELLTDHALGATTLTVGDAGDFNETGGTLVLGLDDGSAQEVVNYNSADLDADTITLAVPLAAAWVAETPVRPYPVTRGRRAMVQLDDEGGAVDARVPFSMGDRIPVGTRETGKGERVVLTLEGAQFVVEDVLGKAPVINDTVVQTSETGERIVIRPDGDSGIIEFFPATGSPPGYINPSDSSNIGEIKIAAPGTGTNAVRITEIGTWFDGAVNFTGKAIGGPSAPHTLRTRNTTQTISNATSEVVTWSDNFSSLPGTWGTSSFSPDATIIPAFFLITASGSFAANATGRRTLRITMTRLATAAESWGGDAGPKYVMAETSVPANAGGTTALCVTAVVWGGASTDIRTFAVEAFQNSGAGLAFTGFQVGIWPLSHK